MSRKRVATVAYENRRKKHVAFTHLVVYPYRRPGQRTDSWAVATSDRPEDVKHRCNSKAAAITWAQKRSGDVRIANEAAECPCPHGEYGKSVEHHLQKMGSPDPAHDLKHSADYVGRCQAGGIDPGMCAAVIYGAVHHHHPPSSHMTEAGEDKAAFRWAEVWFEHVADGSLFVSRIEKIDSTIVADLVGHVVTTNATEHDVDKVLAKGGYKERFVKMDSVRRAAEVGRRMPATSDHLRHWKISFFDEYGRHHTEYMEGYNKDETFSRFLTDMEEHDKSVDTKRPIKIEPFYFRDVESAALREEPVRWWLVVFSQLNGERGEIHVRARTADDALAKAQQDAQIDLSKQVRTIQLKSGARPDLSMGGPSPHAYEDFVAVDATGKVIGTPHKEYFRAKQEAGQTGFVKYVSPTTLEANDSVVSENTWLVVVRGVGTEDTGIPHVISSHRTEREAERARKAERDRSSPYSGDQLFDIAKKLPDGQIKIMPPSQLREDSAPACQPFTRVERDPAKFNACMLRAKDVGPIQGSRKIYDLVHADIEKLDEEHFFVLCLDFRGQVRDYVEITIGQRHRVAVELDDILDKIILSKCDGAVVIHNHPSGDAHPSEADDKLTESIREAMRVACPRIAFIDHVVIGQGQFYSSTDKKLHKV